MIPPVTYLLLGSKTINATKKLVAANDNTADADADSNVVPFAVAA